MIFDTDKLIIVCYPSGAGGKFLINCLGLSDTAVFQDSLLASQQLNGLFTQQDKINLLLQRLDETVDEWHDLDLGCGQLFGCGNLLYLGEYPELILSYEFPDCIQSLIKFNKHYFFIVAHNTIFLEKYLDIWKNAKVIMFENSQEFIRSSNRENSSRFFNIHNRKINEFKDKFPRVLTTWDTNWYFSSEQTVAEIKKLYETLNLDGFNPDIILNYYHAWQNKLLELKSKQ